MRVLLVRVCRGEMRRLIRDYDVIPLSWIADTMEDTAFTMHLWNERHELKINSLCGLQKI